MAFGERINDTVDWIQTKVLIIACQCVLLIIKIMYHCTMLFIAVKISILHLCSILAVIAPQLTLNIYKPSSDQEA